eukprot:g5680.t1
MNLEGPNREGVFVLRFQNGLKENRMNRDFFEQMNRALDVVEKNRDGKAALVITSNGKFFSNGMSMPYLKNSFEEAVDIFQKTLLRLALFGVPVVACLNGHTIAGGAILSLCADVRVMTNTQRRYFWINEVALGVPATDLIASIVRTKVPSHVQNSLLLQSRRYTSQEALRFGIVDEVLSNPESRAIEIAKSLAGRNRQAWAVTKRRMYTSLRYDPMFRAFGGLKKHSQIPERDEAGISYEVNEKTGVATILLNRPRRGNAWTKSMTKRFLDLLDSVECDDRVRCVLLTGSGKFFCLGVDMEQLEMLEDQYGRPFYYARLVPKPVICALNGSAAGIGLALACHCDVRFCAHDAKLTVAYPRRGLVLEHGLSWALERICGMGHAMDLSLTGRRVNAKEAHRMGLVNFVVNRDDLIAQATKYANDLAQNVSPGAMAAAKFQVLKHPSMSMRESLNESNKMMHTSEKCDDLQEGFKSFQEKRPPKFEPVHSKHPLLPSRYERSML